ncbi:MAG TPA: hypothetical protein VNK26_06510, partial [Pyrinomonadaceae bacterium]|nr:hypothetical protein [Pyrinomonadaceae bacterium]
VNAAVSGNLQNLESSSKSKSKRKGGVESALPKIFTGLAFLIISIILSFNPIGHFWWFWMLIPAFGCLGGGIADLYLASKDSSRLQTAGESKGLTNADRAAIGNPLDSHTKVLNSADTSGSGFDSSKNIVPSVTEDTTRLLEVPAKENSN